ncbi:hypothetical protein L484_003446 [Morus notabilis]|uniref:Uncharacterized protein n=1 Tax=Morus notabilis TaxID=981085 RepID=W9R1W3_9ROSA|nr:hypothetical protein L484_003446 [Morus notabilis]
MVGVGEATWHDLDGGDGAAHHHHHLKGGLLRRWGGGKEVLGGGGCRGYLTEIADPISVPAFFSGCSSARCPRHDAGDLQPSPVAALVTSQRRRPPTFSRRCSGHVTTPATSNHLLQPLLCFRSRTFGLHIYQPSAPAAALLPINHLRATSVFIHIPHQSGSQGHVY